ncbi:hypothetical protein ABW636_16990 [Aquimarina sp. 2201CG1-2-11]|uniref:hypothetical protein n=1 Tax=Aquimarina discodermiae TaxID=3231043 RepID=UPI0034620CD9
MNIVEFVEIYKEFPLIEQLRHLSFVRITDEYIVSLIDVDGNEIIRGYGKTAIEALNDMHSNLL